jgi:hypothetical protein
MEFKSTKFFILFQTTQNTAKITWGLKNIKIFSIKEKEKE